jgi:tungstate transport system ATP-binding protein
MSDILAISNLRVERGGRSILDVDRLIVNEGEVLAVIGPNGAGKSTLLLALARLLKTDDGVITYRGESIHKEDDLTYRRRIALVLQEPLLLNRSVFDNVAAGLRFRKTPRADVNQQVDEWLEKLGVAHLRDRQVRRLSGGEAQRVSLARAFALQPELLLLDEPFSALDAPTRMRLLEDLQALLSATSITTLFITHDLDEALFLGERVAVLLDGRLRQVGPPQRVFSAPADRDVAAFVGVETVIAADVLRSIDGQVILKSDNMQLEAVGDFQEGRQVLLCLRPEDVTLYPDDGSPPSSARNRLQGHITRMVPQGPLVRVVLDCGFPLVALITRASATDLDLIEGRMVTAAFKASAVHLIPRLSDQRATNNA